MNDLAGAVRRARFLDRLISWLPFGLYVPLSVGLIGHYLAPGDAPGYDGWLYREAASAWLAGRDPWSVGLPNAHFPGAPSTILAFVPAAAVPAEIWRPLSVLLCLAAAAFIVLRIGDPWWWLAYPPLVTGVLLGQAGVVVPALLLTRVAVAAPLLKPWAALPLLFRPRLAAVAAAIGLVTVVLASTLWAEWLRRLPELSGRLADELHGGVPLWATALGAVALAAVWRKRPAEAPWLAVSAVWPFPEYHNAILALPTRNRLLLLVLAVVPGPPAIVAYAIWLTAQPVLEPRMARLVSAITFTGPRIARVGGGGTHGALPGDQPGCTIRRNRGEGERAPVIPVSEAEPNGGVETTARPIAEPLVAVAIPALNEAGKIGRVLDKFPRDGRFEAIVVDDGSTDGTGDEARRHGAAVVIRHEHRGGVGAAIRDGWQAGLDRGRPYVALLSGDDQHEPGELVGALDALLAADADYLQGSRWRRGGRVIGNTGGRGIGTRVYSAAFSVLAGRRVSDATNGFRIFRASLLSDPSVHLDQAWLDSYDLEPYVLFKAIRGRYRVIEHPCTVVYHAAEGYTKMRGLKDWWRLFRPAVLLRTGVKR